ncbi:MAG: 16S rRNA (cytidine(1402)-2'-O)-methyltransferase [Actinomycetota bacterium]
MHGKLFVCATPIGNLEDVTLRVLRILGEVDLVAAEDTRRTRKLLTHHGIKARLVAYHDRNERAEAPRLLERLERGENLALVSDAGMPTLSDPGYRLVRACIDAGVPIEVVPGASAVPTALAASGLPADRFVFEGFLPRSPGERRRRLDALAEEDRTMVFFEAPNRLAGTLEEIRSAMGDRRVAVARELTKQHEEVVRATIGEVLDALEGREVLGEVVIVVQGGLPTASMDEAVAAAARLLQKGESRSQAAAAAAREFGVKRREVYEALKSYSAEKGSQG